jgi:hypothetical protein
MLHTSNWIKLFENLVQLLVIYFNCGRYRKVHKFISHVRSVDVHTFNQKNCCTIRPAILQFLSGMMESDGYCQANKFKVFKHPEAGPAKAPAQSRHWAIGWYVYYDQVLVLLVVIRLVVLLPLMTSPSLPIQPRPTVGLLLLLVFRVTWKMDDIP